MLCHPSALPPSRLRQQNASLSGSRTGTSDSRHVVRACARPPPKAVKSAPPRMARAGGGCGVSVDGRPLLQCSIPFCDRFLRAFSRTGGGSWSCVRHCSNCPMLRPQTSRKAKSFRYSHPVKFTGIANSWQRNCLLWHHSGCKAGVITGGS